MRLYEQMFSVDEATVRDYLLCPHVSNQGYVL